ncbi:MAG: heavy metal translocating P-type ATPase metal-binding domain-containing protein [Bacteroidetes bacterium]|nr:heavy metal translocating P-type ATPase metal-binding domain-containing protein [Bacteroidota bacterium]
MQKGTHFYCDHCSKLTPEKKLTKTPVNGVERHFCCPGCELSFKVLKQVGYDDYYNLQRKELGLGEERGAVILTEEEQARMDELYREFVQGSGEIKLVYLKIEKIHCAACVFANEEIIRKLPGVLEFNINPGTHRSKIRWDNRLITLAEILNTIANIGYYAYPFHPSKAKPTLDAETKDLTMRLGASALISMNVMLLAIGLYAGYFQGMDPQMKAFLQWINMIMTIPGVFFAGKPILQGAWYNLKSGSPGMDVLIALGSLAAFFLSVWHVITGVGETYFDTANMLIFFILLGRYVESKAKQKILKETDKYDDYRVETVTKIHDGIRINSGLDDVAKGDFLEFYPGDILPVDGVITNGTSAFDESVLTGESIPRQKTSGDQVISGSRNLDDTFIMQVTSVGDGTIFSRVLELIEDSQLSKSPISRLVDQVSTKFIYFILLSASISFIWWNLTSGFEIAFPIAISVLVIACPCAMGIATPMALLVGTGESLKRGVLIKSGEVLEELVKVNQVVFDKTGTLTTGIMKVVAVHEFDETVDKTELYSALAHAETEVYHPVARAIRTHFFGLTGKYEGYSDFAGFGGKGITFQTGSYKVAAGNTKLMEDEGVEFLSHLGLIKSIAGNGHVPVLIAVNGTLVSILEIADEIRTEAKETLAKLAEMKIPVIILSGDRKENVNQLARVLGLSQDQVKGELSPEDKANEIRKLIESGKTVMMIGDGVNDAPALSLAQVGISMGEGSQISLDSSGVVLLNNSLPSVVKSITLARATYSKIRQNLFWALFYNVVMIPIGAFGILIPIWAAAAMSLSSISVVFNSLLLRRTVSSSFRRMGY